LENADNIKIMANTWIIRKNALINNSEMLEKYSANKIKNLDKESLITVNI